jgi:hypothetical protein
MLNIIVALAVGASSPASPSTRWEPSGCASASVLPEHQVHLAEIEARHGNIGASVSLECHYLAVGDEAKAIAWLRLSGSREPFTGRRYIRYLLSVGGNDNCRIAHALAVKYLSLDWLPIDVHREFSTQQKRAHVCS